MPDVVRRNFRQYDKDNKQAGMIAPSGLGWTPSGTAIAANAGRISRFVPSRNMTIISIAYSVQAWAAGDTADPAVDVGIYNAALTSKLASSGATAGKIATVGAKNVLLSASLALTAGTVYYAALSVGALGTSTVSINCGTYLSTGAHTLFGATAGLLEVDLQTSVHPLPAAWTVSGGSTGGPILALRET